MGDNRAEAYLQNPFLIYSAVQKLRHKFTVNFSATFYFLDWFHVSTLTG